MPPALLDTDILSELLKLRNANVRAKALSYTSHHGQIAISAVSRYEVNRGYKDLNATTQLTRFAAFCGHSLVLSLTDAIFDCAADLGYSLAAEDTRAPMRICSSHRQPSNTVAFL